MLHNLSVGELAERLRLRELSSVELTRHFLARIERLNPALNALITLTADAALAAAAAADRLEGGESGPLLGIPLTKIFSGRWCAHQLWFAHVGQFRRTRRSGARLRRRAPSCREPTRTSSPWDLEQTRTTAR
jgi:hypothetical protein